MAFAYPSFTNVYMPNVSTNVEVTANLVVNFSRSKASDFPINDYVKIIPVKKNLGFYKRIAIGQQARLQYNDARNFLWNPGQERPKGNWNQQGFSNFPYATNRYSFTSTLDQMEIDQADFQIQPIHVAMLAQQCLTWRSQLVANTITTTANWDASHVTTMSALAGGTITNATGTNPYVMKLFQQAAILVNRDTLGAVRNNQLSALMNPVTAAAISTSQEWRDYLAQQVNSVKFLEGASPTPAENWNLTRKINGIRVIIEDAVRNNAPPTPEDSLGAAVNQYVLPDGVIIFLGRPGDLVGGEGATDFSTVQLFVYEEMVTESIADSWNRLQMLAVTDNIDCRLVAPASGVYVSGCI